MRIQDVPNHPAYLVFHDAFDKGAMDIWGMDDFTRAEKIAEKRNTYLSETSDNDCGLWKAYNKLPRVRVHAYHGKKEETIR